MTSMSELSDDDIVIACLSEKIRQLTDDLAKERRLKSEILGRYDSLLLDKHSQETRIALLEAELKRAKRGEPTPSVEVRADMTVEAFRGMA